MEVKEHWLHSTRRQIIKTLGHLLDARKAINLSIDHVKLIGNQSDTCAMIQQNIDALSEGIDDTIKHCGTAAEAFKQQMSDPNATPAPIYGKKAKFYLTPFQKTLEAEGVATFETNQTQVAPARPPKKISPLPFTLIPPPTQRRRRRTKENFPL